MDGKASSVPAGCGLGGQVFEVQGLCGQEASGSHSCCFSSSFIPRAGSLYAGDVTTVIPFYRLKKKKAQHCDGSNLSLTPERRPGPSSSARRQGLVLPPARQTRAVGRIQGFESWTSPSSPRRGRLCLAEARSLPPDPASPCRTPPLSANSPPLWEPLVHHETLRSPPGGAGENCVLRPPAGPEWVWKPPSFPAPALQYLPSLTSSGPRPEVGGDNHRNRRLEVPGFALLVLTSAGSNLQLQLP